MEKRLYFAIDEWLKDYKRNSVKEATYDRLRISLAMLRRYSISDRFVHDLETIDIQRYINRLYSDGYSQSTIKKQYTMLTAYFKHALSVGDMERPIHLGVSLPKSTKSAESSDIQTYSNLEQAKLTRVLETLEDRTYAAVILMLETGMRIGEVLALEWSDILWNRRAVRISKTLVRLSEVPGESFVQSSAKSKTSNRTVPLSRKAIDILTRIHDREYGLIFPMGSPDIPTSYSSIRYHVKKACAKADVPYKGMHVFRHTFATNCYHKGCDVKILSKLLGHATVSITYDIYIHLYGDALEEMRSVVD